MTTHSKYPLQNFSTNNAKVLTENSQPVFDFKFSTFQNRDLLRHVFSKSSPVVNSPVLNSPVVNSQRDGACHDFKKT